MMMMRMMLGQQETRVRVVPTVSASRPSSGIETEREGGSSVVVGGAFQLQCQLGTQCCRPRLQQGMAEQAFLETLECDIEQAITALKKGMQLLKYGARGNLSFASSDYPM
jgi:hypothetical protein